MENRKIKLSIIILSYNTKDLLKKCLESVIRCWWLGDSGEVIVVDNGSTDGSDEMVSKEYPKIKLIKNKENLGYSKGNNVGIREAKGEYVMLLNSDTVVKNGAIEKLIDLLNNHEEVDIVGPRLLNTDGTFQENCGRFPDFKVTILMLFAEHFGNRVVRWAPRESGYVDWMMGAAFIARKKVFEKTGLLDEKMFMYMEEVEWFYRAKKAEFKTYFLKESEIIHLGMGSSKTGKTEPILNIYRGLIYFYRKHRTPPELLILKILLKLKALFALTFGYLKNDDYLKKTYGEAIKIN